MPFLPAKTTHAGKIGVGIVPLSHPIHLCDFYHRCPLGLYAEQISGTAFTAPRKENLRTWMYR